MPTTKHTATFDGQTFKRTSKSKVYTHVTLGRRSEEKAFLAANSKAERDQDGRNYDFYKGCIDGTYRSHVERFNTAEDIERRKADYADHILAGETREAYQDRQQADRNAKVQATDFTTWHDLGWSSREDLAVKNAASHRGNAYWAEVVIVAVDQA